MTETSREPDPRDGPGAGSSHSVCVDRWVEGATKGLAPAIRPHLYARGLAAVWKRADHPLAGITLAAAFDRTLHVGKERFPFLTRLTVDATGIRFGSLIDSPRAAEDVELEAGLRFVLVEFLALLGTLTGEILTPSLQAALERVQPLAEPEPGATHPEGQEP